MAISAVGSLTTTSPSGGATTVKSVTTTTAGNLLILYTLVLNGARTITSVAGGTADGGGWTKLGSQNSGAEIIEIWWAKVGTPGTANITVTWNSSTAGMFLIHGNREFTNGTGASTIWQVDGTGSGQTNASATTAAYPPKTPSAAGRLYVGYAGGLGGQPLVSAGGTPAGFTFQIDTFDNAFAYNPNVSALVSPATGPGNAQTSYSVGGLLAVAITLVPVTDSGVGTLDPTIAATVTQTDAGTATDSFALLRASDLVDAGTTTDSFTLVEERTLADGGIGAEVIDVQDIVHVAFTDGGTGTESLFVDIPELIASADSGTGTETLNIAPVANSADGGTGTEAFTIGATLTPVVDSGAGVDAFTLLRQATVPDTATGDMVVALTAQQGLADGGVGTEAFTILRASAVTDGGVGTEVIGSGPNVADGGVGEMFLDLVIIPFTQVLPLRQGPVYDLVVVARVPQVSGAPTFLEVNPIEWKSLTYSNTLSQPQELSASCQISSLTEEVLQRLRDLDTLATELWLYRNGKVVFAGPIAGYQTAGEDLTITCKGLLYYLRFMAIQQDLAYVQIDQFVMVKEMVDQWQNLEYGNFGIDTSGVVASGVLRDGKYLATELHNVGQRVEDLGKAANGFDSEVDPATRKLQLWNPTKGVDRSSGEDAIVLDSRNITSGDIICSVAVGDLASDSYVTSSPQGQDAPLTSTKVNDELRKKFGRTAITQSFSDVADQATLDSYAQALIDARANALMVPGPKVRVTPDADLSAYGVGDRIAYELSAVLSVSGSFRIRKQVINVGSNGSESVDLEFV